jgi:hypothetical protein
MGDPLAAIRAQLKAQQPAAAANTGLLPELGSLLLAIATANGHPNPPAWVQTVLNILALL